MKIVVACDSYKGSCSAVSAALCMEEGIRRVFPHAEVERIPMADGGEGTVEAVLAAAGGSLLEEEVGDPLGRPVRASCGVLKDGTAVIEMAAASGLTLLSPDERNPLKTTTYGTGELIRAVLDRGCRRIWIGIGGSATNDGGAGMAQALGARLLDKDGKDLPPGGGALGRLHRIDVSGLDRRLGRTQIAAACDVSNPLCGARGASAVYGPQKGATQEMVRILDENLAHFAGIVKEQLGRDIAEEKGAGAAGGLGAGLMLFCGAQMEPGIQTVLDMTDFDARAAGADLVITGEGQIDYQSAFGKVPVGVAGRAKKLGKIPVVAIVGNIGAGAEKVYSHGIDTVFSIVPGAVSLEYAMENAERLIADASERVMRLVKASSGILPGQI